MSLSEPIQKCIALNHELSYGMNMTRTYSCPIEIRAYELDASGHVNHACYLHYFEHARWKMLEEEGITLESFKKWEVWPVIIHVDIQYLKPSFLGDSLIVRTKIIENSKASYYFEQNLYKGETLLAKGRLRGAVMDLEGKPARLPEGMKKLWENHL